MTTIRNLWKNGSHGVASTLSRWLTSGTMYYEKKPTIYCANSTCCTPTYRWITDLRRTLNKLGLEGIQRSRVPQSLVVAMFDGSLWRFLCILGFIVMIEPPP